MVRLYRQGHCQVRQRHKHGVTLGPLDDAGAMAHEGIVETNRSEFTCVFDTIEIDMERHPTGSETVFVDENIGRARHDISTPHASNNPFGEMCFACAQPTRKQYEVCRQKQCTDDCTKCNRLGDFAEDVGL